jgi:hypothetical protein
MADDCHSPVTVTSLTEPAPQGKAAREKSRLEGTAETMPCLDPDMEKFLCFHDGGY